jgi:hypothetical protein
MRQGILDLKSPSGLSYRGSTNGSEVLDNMAYTPMFESWRVRMNGRIFNLTLDLGRGEDYPLADKRWFFGVRVPMADKQENGLPGPDEARRLDVVENRIRAIVKERDGLYVGRRTGAFNRDLLFYTAARARECEDRIRGSVGLEILFISRSDPKWEGFEQLLPSAKDWQQIEEQKRIDELANQGVDIDCPHRVTYSIAVPIQQGAEALVRMMPKLDLADVEITGEEPNLIVTGCHIVPMDAEMIADVTWVLVNKSPKARGEYIGWEAESVTTELVESPETEEDLLSLLSDLALSE